MEGLIQTLTLDMNGPRLTTKLRAKQLDTNSRYLMIRLTADGAPWKLPADCEVYLYAKKQDDTVVFNRCKIVGWDSVLAPLTDQMLALPEDVDCELYIVAPDGDLKSQIFTLKVDAMLYDGNAIESANEFGGLMEIMEELRKAREQLENGTNGAPGKNGADGKSAYEIAVDNGFVGAETEWVESLVGADGIDGIAPHIGDNGNWYIGDTDTGTAAQGPQGTQGETGPRGPQGPKGETGTASGDFVLMAPFQVWIEEKIEESFENGEMVTRTSTRVTQTDAHISVPYGVDYIQDDQEFMIASITPEIERDLANMEEELAVVSVGTDDTNMYQDPIIRPGHGLVFKVIAYSAKSCLVKGRLRVHLVPYREHMYQTN